ncbi:glycosyltransferase family 2 protein [Lysobacter xanthus]
MVPVPPARDPLTGPILSVLVPVYDEADVLVEFHARLAAVLDVLSMSAEVIYVDDGSRDGSAGLIATLSMSDPRIGAVRLSRNFGKEVALAAGLDHVRGEAVVVIDADLQDPPELIPAMVSAWRAGADQVEMKRRSRAGETLTKRWTAFAFYRVMRRFTRVDMTPDVGDFRLMSRRAVVALRALGERARFMKGLYAWIGFERVQLEYDRAPRHSGITKWSYGRLWALAIEGLTSFTTAPLRLASYVGLLVSLAAFGYGAIIIAKTLAFGERVTGYPSLMVVLLFLGGAQLLCIGVLGEYLGRMFVETKHRPLYIVDRFVAPRVGDGT